MIIIINDNNNNNSNNNNNNNENSELNHLSNQTENIKTNTVGSHKRFD